MKALTEANDLLAAIAARRADIEQLEFKAQAEMDVVLRKYEPDIQACREMLAESEKDLIALMKKHTAEIFDGRDKVVVQNGVLLHTQAARVSIPRDALTRLKSLGWIEAVKVIESVAREVVDLWPLERLAAIGASRKVKHEYKYEVKIG